MRSPIRPIPESVQRWVVWGRMLRWVDALWGWLLLWFILTRFLPAVPAKSVALGALLVLGILAPVAPLRRHWRPVSGAVCMWTSRSVDVGDMAWLVGHASAERVIVTARRGTRMTVAIPGGDVTEGVRVRRTRVFVVPS